MKKSKKDRKKLIKIAIILCIGLIICLLLFLAFLKKDKQPEEKIVTTEEKQESVTNYVRNKSEKERMQIYLSEYLQYIEQREYDLAYNVLYPEFKENYFITKENYIYYVQENYSDLMMVDYENIERQGHYYILTVAITNLDNTGSSKTQKFILFEKGLNDYYLSFQVK